MRACVRVNVRGQCKVSVRVTVSVKVRVRDRVTVSVRASSVHGLSHPLL